MTKWLDWDPDEGSMGVVVCGGRTGDNKRRGMRRHKEEHMNAEEKLEALLEATKTEETIIKLPLEVYELDTLFDAVFEDAIERAADERSEYVGGSGDVGKAFRRIRGKRTICAEARKAGYIPRKERKENHR